MILWNLAADPNNKPHTDNGGCTMCQGAITIDGDHVERNLAYYVIGHASKFVPTGSSRIFSTPTSTVSNVAFLTPEGNSVLILANNSSATQIVNIQEGSLGFSHKIDVGSTVTLIWKNK